MARNTDNKKQQAGNKNEKSRKGDTGRTSNQGRKQASGGSKETSNQGHRRGV